MICGQISLTVLSPVWLSQPSHIGSFYLIVLSPSHYKPTSTPVVVFVDGDRLLPVLSVNNMAGKQHPSSQCPSTRRDWARSSSLPHHGQPRATGIRPHGKGATARLPRAHNKRSHLCKQPIRPPHGPRRVNTSRPLQLAPTSSITQLPPLTPPSPPRPPPPHNLILNTSITGKPRPCVKSSA